MLLKATLNTGVTGSHVEYVGHAGRERQHDDRERDEKEENVLHHVVQAEDDRTHVLWRNPNLQNSDSL